MHFMSFHLIFHLDLEGVRNGFKGHLDHFLGYREKVKWRFITNQLIFLISKLSFDFLREMTYFLVFNWFDPRVGKR